MANQSYWNLEVERWEALRHALLHAVQDSRLPAGFDIDGTIAALERARVVGVLDAWADKPNRARSWEVLKRDDGWDCMLHSGTGKTLFAGVQPTPAAARAAAAKAIEAGEV